MFDVEKIVDRANLLGLDDEQLDADGVLYIKSGKLELCLDNLVRISDDEYKFVIPEGIEKIYIDLNSDAYKNKVPYEFIFPASATYIGVRSKNRNQNCVYLSDNDFVSRDRFRLSTFDFRKCNKINIILGHFSDLSINKVLFNKSVRATTGGVFYNCNIWELSMPGMVRVGNNVFLNSKIHKLDIGRGCQVLSEGAFCFDWVCDELIFDRVVGCENHVFKNVRNVYIGLDIHTIGSQLQADLLGLAERCNTDYFGDVLKLMGSKVEEYKAKLNIGGELYKLYKYLQLCIKRENGFDEFGDALSYCLRSLFVESIEAKLYLFDTAKTSDIHKRDYKLVYNYKELDIKLYVEL